MNRFNQILAFVLLMLCISARAQYITNATVTITSAPAAGMSISINGNVRTWSTNVTNISLQLPLTTMYSVAFNAQTSNSDLITVNGNAVWYFTNATTPNIPLGTNAASTNFVLLGTNSASSMTNLFNAYSNSPSPFTTIAIAPNTSNQIVIYSYYGVPLSTTVSQGTNLAASLAVAATNDIGIQTSNLFFGYGLYLNPTTMNIFQGPATNQVQFQSFPSSAMTILFPTNGWGSVSYNAVIPTNLLAVVVPEGAQSLSVMSSSLRSNEEAGIVSLLNDYPVIGSNLFGQSNVINQTNPIWVEFLGTNFGAGVTNLILTMGTNLTNFTTNVYMNTSNYTWVEATNSTNFTIQYAGLLSTNASNYAHLTLGAVWSNSFAPLSSIAPWQDNGADVYLTNAAGVLRLEAQNNSGSLGGVFELYESDGSTLWLYNDDQGNTFLYDRHSNQRFEMDDQATGVSNTYIRSGIGLNLANNGPAIGSGAAVGGGLAIGGQNGTVFVSRPIVMQNATVPSVTIGTVTNFANFQVTSDTIYNSNYIAGDCLTNAGDTLIRNIGLSFAAGSGYSFDLYFCGQAIFTSGAFNAISGGAMSLRAEVTSDGGGSFHYNCMAICSDLNTNSFSSVGHHSFTGSTNFYISVIADVGLDDITVETDNEMLAPSSKWSVLP